MTKFMKLGNIRQIIVYVEDMTKQVEFYRDTLGLQISYPIQDDYTGVDWVAFNTGECTLALHSGGKGRIGEDGPKFTFEVENVEETMTLLQEKGVITGGTREAYPGSYVGDLKDIEENWFFIQSHPKH